MVLILEGGKTSWVLVCLGPSLWIMSQWCLGPRTIKGVMCVLVGQSFFNFFFICKDVKKSHWFSWTGPGVPFFLIPFRFLDLAGYEDSIQIPGRVEGPWNRTAKNGTQTTGSWFWHTLGLNNSQIKNEIWLNQAFSLDEGSEHVWKPSSLSQDAAVAAAHVSHACRATKSSRAATQKPRVASSCLERSKLADDPRFCSKKSRPLQHSKNKGKTWKMLCFHREKWKGYEGILTTKGGLLGLLA